LIKLIGAATGAAIAAITGLPAPEDPPGI